MGSFLNDLVPVLVAPLIPAIMSNVDKTQARRRNRWHWPPILSAAFRVSELAMMLLCLILEATLHDLMNLMPGEEWQHRSTLTSFRVSSISSCGHSSGMLGSAMQKPECVIANRIPS